MKYLIVGRTATGKDTLVDKLCKDYPDKFSKVISRTTRPPRDDNDTSHIFVTKKQAKKDENNKIAKTIISDNEYYILPEDIKDKNLYIVDPTGVYDIVKNMPNEYFTIVYTCAKKYQQQEAFVKRLQKTTDISKEEAIEEFNKRFDAENEQFTEFERSAVDETGDMPDDAFNKNVPKIITLETNYTDIKLERHTKTLYTDLCAKEELIKLVPKAIKAGILNAGDKPNTIKTFNYNGTDGDLDTEYVIAVMLSDAEALSSFLISLLLATDTFDKFKQDKGVDKNEFGQSNRAWSRISQALPWRKSR